MGIEELKRKIEAKNLKLNPVLSESEVASFEKKYGITLPEEYRKFLLNVGNGGDGPPYYNLLPLGKATKDAYDEEREVWERFIYINKEFPFTEYWCWENEEDQESAYYGSLMLGTDGCGINWLLIITGKSRGEIWQITGEGIIHCQPKTNFTEWYDHWLEKGDAVNYFE